MVTVTIGRDSLSLADLVFSGDPTGDFHVPEDGVRWPRVALRRIYAPESEFIAGRVKLAQVAGVADYPLSLYVHGATTAEIAANMDALEAAVTQFEFDLTIAVDGESRTYTAEGDYPDWGEVDHSHLRGHFVKGAVTFNLLRRTA